MFELTREIYQEFYKNILDRYVVQNTLAKDNNESVSFKLVTGVDVLLIKEETEITWHDQTTYKGSMLRNQFDGAGILCFPNDSKYVGNFVNGLYEGDGTFTSPSHRLTYKGKFFKGLPHGKAILKIENDDTFEGEFRCGKKVRGIHVHRNGTFIGEFENGTQSRKYGRYFSKLGKCLYTGPFYKGYPHGVGTIEWNHREKNKYGITVIPEIFNGCLVKGMKHGLGILRWNKMLVVTVWNNDYKNGPGLLITCNGDVFTSIQMFEQDQFMNAKKVFLTHEKIVLIKKIIQSTHFEINHFKQIVLQIIQDAKDLSNVFPFHIPDYQIELNTTPIYNFISNILKSKSLSICPEEEFKSINQVIIDQYFSLREIYERYADFGTSNKNGCNIMNRLGLWQLIRDLNFDACSINIANLITTAETEFQIIVLNSNDFREPVYFCAFLRYLLYLTMIVHEGETNRNYAIERKPPFFGYFATMFVIFLRHVVLKVVPFSKGNLSKKMLENNLNLVNFLTYCAKLTGEMNIRTVFQCLQVFESNETISDVNLLWNSKYKNPELFQSVSLLDIYECAKVIFPQLITKEAHGLSEENALITFSTFKISPLEFYELFEAVVIVALKKKKINSEI